jgi:hypothetical protein
LEFLIVPVGKVNCYIARENILSGICCKLVWPSTISARVFGHANAGRSVGMIFVRTQRSVFRDKRDPASAIPPRLRAGGIDQAFKAAAMPRNDVGATDTELIFPAPRNADGLFSG